MDKVQKIREEVERIQLYTQSEVLKQVLDYIDKVQEEPQVKESAKVQHVDKMCKENGNSLTQELVNEGLEEEVRKLWREINTGHEYAILDSYDILYGMCLDIANWQKEQFEKERLKHCDELTAEQAQIESDFVTQHLKENNRIPTFIDAIEYGMRLKEKEMQSTIELAEDHAMLAGMEKMKEEMMAKAIDGEVGYWNQRGLSVLMELPRELEVDDKCKVIIIKEE